MEKKINLEDLENIPINRYKKTIDSIYELSSDNSILITEEIIFEGKKSNLSKFKIGRYYLFLTKLIFSFYLLRKIFPSFFLLYFENEKFMIQVIFLILSIFYFLPFLLHFFYHKKLRFYKELKIDNTI